MTWDGDISRIGQLAQRVADLARVPSRAAPAVAKRISELVEEQFAGEADPYGNAWAPHAEATIARWGPHPILHLSGAMHEGIRVTPMAGSGISITVPHPGAPHQTGWSGPQGAGPARPILPARAMPPRWREAIEVEITNEFLRAG